MLAETSTAAAMNRIIIRGKNRVTMQLRAEKTADPSDTFPMQSLYCFTVDFSTPIVFFNFQAKLS